MFYSHLLSGCHYYSISGNVISNTNIYLADFINFIVKYSALFALSTITTDDQKLAIQIYRRHFAYCLNKHV